MKPDKLTVRELFERERRFVIPLYQRSYVWNRVDQWEPLWEDIEHQAELCRLAAEHVSKKSHFLGAIVLNVSKIQGRSVSRSEVIDGQQRLTTLQLFLGAFRDFASQAGDATAAVLKRLTENPDCDPLSEEKHKVWPTNADRDVFSKIMNAKGPDDIKALFPSGLETLPRIAEAYMFFWNAVKDYVGHAVDDEGRSDRLFAISQALRTGLQFVVIELEESDDPQVIFETLNARGQPLLPSDLIRNYVFLQAANTTGVDADRLYSTYWRPFDDLRLEKPDAEGEDRFWHIKERQGRLTRPRIDLFMFHFLVMKTEEDLNIGQLFREFRDWRDGQTGSIEELLAELKINSERFARLVDPKGTDRLAKFAARLKSLDTSTVYPVLLFLLGLPEQKLSAQQRDQAFADLESFLIRRFVCQQTNKNYNRFFLGLLIKAKRAAEADASVADAVREELLRSQETSAVWPTDADFRRGWLTLPIYVKSRIDRCATLLRALEEHLRSPRNEGITIPDALTVEHLLPQKPDFADYPYAATMPVQNDETTERCRARLIHTVGNLTLLTQALNGSASNGPFPEKRTKIVEDSDLRLNAWLRTDNRTSWDEADIIVRGEKLFEHARLIWQRPDSPAV